MRPGAAQRGEHVMDQPAPVRDRRTPELGARGLHPPLLVQQPEQPLRQAVTELLGLRPGRVGERVERTVEYVAGDPYPPFPRIGVHEEPVLVVDVREEGVRGLRIDQHRAAADGQHKRLAADSSFVDGANDALQDRRVVLGRFSARKHLHVTRQCQQVLMNIEIFGDGARQVEQRDGWCRAMITPGAGARQGSIPPEGGTVVFAPTQAGQPAAGGWCLEGG